MLTVEFTGVPGSGKSTLYRATCEFFEKVEDSSFDSVSICDKAAADYLRQEAKRSSLLFRTLILSKRFSLILLNKRRVYLEFLSRFISTYPELVGRLANVRASSDPGQIHALLRAFAEYQMAYDYLDNSAFCVFDEGLLHKLLPVFAQLPDSHSFEFINEVVSLLPRVDLVISVEAEVDSCIQRVKERSKTNPWSKGAKFSNQQLRQNYEAGDHAKHLLLEAAQNNGTDVIKVFNNSSLKEAVEALHKSLARWYKSFRSPKKDS